MAILEILVFSNPIEFHNSPLLVDIKIPLLVPAKMFVSQVLFRHEAKTLTFVFPKPPFEMIQLEPLFVER